MSWAWATASGMPSSNSSLRARSSITSARWSSGCRRRMSRQMLSASTGSFSSRYRSAFSRARGIASRERGFSSNMLPSSRPSALLEEAKEPHERIVRVVHHPLLERDDRVIGDGNALRAHLGAAFRDVAIADPERLLQGGPPVLHVQRMHLEPGHVDEEARADEPILQPVLAQDVADVLAQEALDALAELLHAIDVPLGHAPAPVRGVGGAGSERG